MKLSHSIFSNKNAPFNGFFFLTGFHRTKEQFYVGLILNGEVVEAGFFTEGLSKEEKTALMNTIMNKVTNDGKKQKISLKPTICVELSFDGFSRNKLLNPAFLSFQLQVDWQQCTWGNLIIRNSSAHVQITSPDKQLWDAPSITKDQYIAYLTEAAPRMLPFLQDRPVTLKRAPEGISSEQFYQKNCPEYAPDFIKTYEAEDNHYIVCDQLSTLLWLGNQAAIEYHIPFNTTESNNPREIVFDLDPPDGDHFPMAIKAAKEMKERLDMFDIESFPKLSGNKGLQIHIPFADRTLTYEDTRIFTSFMAHYLVEKHSDDFTIERMKKKRGKKLYIDFVQHWRGKTIICPYSTRVNPDATVAVPLRWQEVNDKLTPKNYTIFSMLERIQNRQCPMNNYFQVENEQIPKVINKLKNH
ncbi:DNA ligase D [Evansella halocellulosilytica]|uniref:DNA ligase D n=1 Tax=Evansella halocellulosilytica TaxID=2011013 RepID=UPI000BB7F96F|nr:DNA ligase D [Evansella halocellulosilytica]